MAMNVPLVLNKVHYLCRFIKITENDNNTISTNCIDNIIPLLLQTIILDEYNPVLFQRVVN